MDNQISDLILSEIRGMRTEMNEGFSETKQRITAIETNTEPFFENEGGKDKIEQDIKDLNKTKYLVWGGAGVLTTLGHWLLHKLGV